MGAQVAVRAGRPVLGGYSYGGLVGINGGGGGGDIWEGDGY